MNPESVVPPFLEGPPQRCQHFPTVGDGTRANLIVRVVEQGLVLVPVNPIPAVLRPRLECHPGL